MNLSEQESSPLCDYATIPLSKGLSAKISPHRLEWAMQWKWYATVCGEGRSLYAVRMSRVSDGGHRRKLYLHREIMRALGDIEVDHRRTKDTLDCTDGNLRLASHDQNKFNRGKTLQNTSGYVGVHRGDCAWIATISHNDKYLHIGSFPDRESAAVARDKKAIELRGEFAHLNFPRENYT